MASINVISPEKLARLVGTPKCPAIVDVRLQEHLQAAPRFIPSAVRRDASKVQDWAPEFAERSVVVVCHSGRDISQGVAAWLRQAGAASADTLEGGFDAWGIAALPSVPDAKVPPRDAKGRTVWVTRSRPKVDRIACPWLIRRFVDPSAVFLFVAPVDVETVAQRFGGTPFDMEGVYWSHRGERCSFDMMVEEFDLNIEPLLRLALIVRGADTDRLDLAPEAAGLLAASLGLSRQYADDLEQLEAGMALYDAFYRWCRDATGETHNWPSSTPTPPRAPRKVTA